MADTDANGKRIGGRAPRGRTHQRLPDGVQVDFGKICVLCRKYPRVHGRKGDAAIHIRDGIMIPGRDVTFQGRPLEGSYKILDRDISADRIEVKPQKVRGSRNHHKFMVILTNGVVS